MNEWLSMNVFVHFMCQGMVFSLCISHLFVLRKRKRQIKIYQVESDGNDADCREWARVLAGKMGKGLVIWFINCTRVYSHWKPSKIIVSTLHIFDDNKNIQPPLSFVIAPYFWSTFASAILIPKLIVDRITFCVVVFFHQTATPLFPSPAIMHLFW